jgi:hypothetical protein
MKRFMISSITIQLVFIKRSTRRSIIRKPMLFLSTSIKKAIKPRLKIWLIEAWTRKSGVLLTKRFLVSMPKRDKHLHQIPMVP